MNSPAGVLLMRYLQNREEDRARQILIEDENLLNINVNLQDKCGCTLLYHACKHGFDEIVSKLLDRNASIDVETKSGETALHSSCFSGNENIVSKLLLRGALINCQNKSHTSPLHIASYWARLNVVSLLLDNGANINIQDISGDTALHVATQRGHQNVVNLLLSRGADPNIMNWNGQVPSDLPRWSSRWINETNNILEATPVVNIPEGHIERDHLIISNLDYGVPEPQRSPATSERETKLLEVDHGTNLNIDLLTLISEYLVEIAIRGQIYSVVGIGDLLANLRANNNLLTEVDLLSLLTSGNLDLEASLRQSLFFGLLLPMGLTVIFEDGFLIAPTLQDQYSHTIVGSATFMRRIDDQIPDHSPNVASFCEWIGNLPRGYRIHTLIAFIHDQLTQLRESEVSELARFRLKSYSSIINKLFYRGKSLKDLFAITVQSQTEADVIKGALENDYGYLSKTYRDYTNNNGCLTYRYIRILILTIENETIHFPVYYEIVVDNLVTPRSHKIYELDRLRCELAPGQIAILARTSFDLYRVLSPTLTDSEKWVKELRYLAKEYQITDTCRLIPLLSQETTPAIGSPDRVEMMNVFLKYVKLEENSSVER